jgi:hypothetical protein
MPSTPDHEEPHTTSPSPGLLTVRAAVVLLLAGMVGVLVGLLSYVEDASLPTAVIKAVLAAVIALVPLNRLIGH